MNKKRFVWGILYLLSGFSVMIWLNITGNLNFLQFIKDYLKQILWCLGWSATGIGSGLINSRNIGVDKPESVVNKCSHYIFYFVFVLFIATLTALLTFLMIKDCIVLSYIASALVGIVIGFMGDSLAGAMERLLPKSE